MSADVCSLGCYRMLAILHKDWETVFREMKRDLEERLDQGERTCWYDEFCMLDLEKKMLREKFQVLFGWTSTLIFGVFDTGTEMILDIGITKDEREDEYEISQGGFLGTFCAGIYLVQELKNILLTGAGSTAPGEVVRDQIPFLLRKGEYLFIDENKERVVALSDALENPG